ncbi:MAG: hypothetical protein V3V28_12980 [Polaribacter sp.]|uniref:hypothetical protein n=1 Tax=Polaribacter sp. TaxID=1920175 RepID=UPI002F356482
MKALNLIHFSPYEYGLDLEALLVFSLGSSILVYILLFYHNRISKSNTLKDELDNPIYQTKDILLQSNSNDSELIITKSSTSTIVKIIVFILIAFVVLIPVDQLLSGVNSFI